MYLGKHDAYSIPNSSQAHWTVVVYSACDRETTSCGGTKYSCKNLTHYMYFGDDRQNSTNISGNEISLVLVCELDIDAT